MYSPPESDAASLVKEIVWRCQQRGTKELSFLLERIFHRDIGDHFADWSLALLVELNIFLQADEQWLMDLLLSVTGADITRQLSATSNGQQRNFFCSPPLLAMLLPRLNIDQSE